VISSEITENMENQGFHTTERQTNQMIVNDTNINSHEQQTGVVHRLTSASGSDVKDDVHLIPLDDLYKRFCTDPHQGLSGSSIVDAEAGYGANKIVPSRTPSFFSLLFKELFIGFNIILWLAGSLAFLAYKPLGEPDPSIANLALGVIVFSVIICNSLLNVYQEMKSMRMISSFSNTTPIIVIVRRNSREQEILADRLLPGDIILIRTGDKLPADCRFIICNGLKVNISRNSRNSFQNEIFHIVDQSRGNNRRINTDYVHHSLHK
jgi:magnesium-transporting ATPase (P-type)